MISYTRAPDPFEIVDLTPYCTQVEPAHGGRGNAPSHDRGSGGFGGGARRGVSRHSEYRGMVWIHVENNVHLLFCLQS